MVSPYNGTTVGLDGATWDGREMLEADTDLLLHGIRCCLEVITSLMNHCLAVVT